MSFTSEIIVSEIIVCGGSYCSFRCGGGAGEAVVERGWYVKEIILTLDIIIYTGAWRRGAA